MKTYHFLTIILIGSASTIFILWMWSLRRSGKLIFPVRQSNAKSKPDTAPAVPRDDGTSVVSRTNAVLLTDPKAETPPVVESTDLEPTGHIGQEEEMTDEDIENDYEPPAPVPSDDELYDEPSGYPTDEDLSSGISFEEIGEAVEVLKAPAATDERTKTGKVDNVEDIRIRDFDIHMYV